MFEGPLAQRGPENDLAPWCSTSEIDAVDERRVRVEEKELRDGVSVGCDHQEENQPVPKREAIEGVWHPDWWVRGERVAHPPVDLDGPAIKHGEVPDEQQRANQHDVAANSRDQRPRCPIGDRGI